MNPLEKGLLVYWRTLTGSELRLQEAAADFLPLFLRSRYLIRTANLFGPRYHLAIENVSEEPCSPGEYADHLRVLGEILGGKVALVVSGRHFVSDQRGRG